MYSTAMNCCFKSSLKIDLRLKDIRGAKIRITVRPPRRGLPQVGLLQAQLVLQDFHPLAMKGTLVCTTYVQRKLTQH
jgi:hypothetical protein